MPKASVSRKAGLREFEERACAMREALSLRRQPVLFVATHLAERKSESIGKKHRIVAEALTPARRPDERAVHAPLEFLHMAVRPRDGEHGDEMSLAFLRREAIALAQAGLDLLHRLAKVLRLARPARRIDAGCAIERIDYQS